MDWIDLGIKAFVLTMIAIAVSIVITFFFPPVSAVVVNQGDTVYLNDTVDISRAIAWPDYKIAWCRGGYYGCTPPDQVIQVEGYMYKYFIDPKVFNYGWYYRWDGQWNRGEYAVAFRVAPGERPDMADMKEDNRVPEPTPAPNTTIEGPYHYLITRGDNPTMTIRTARTDNGYFWMWGSGNGSLGLPMENDGKYDYTVRFGVKDTENLPLGKYNGYLQFAGKNGRQDVFWSRTEYCLDTPYDDAIIPDYCVNETTQASDVKKAFENLVKKGEYSDDVLMPITMQVVPPTIIITDVLNDDEGIWIDGKTSWANGTNITIKMDEDNYALEDEKVLHTWETTATGFIGDYRKFSITVPIELKEMYVGVHDLNLSVNKNNYSSTMYHNFRIQEIFIKPTPTIEVRRVVSGLNDTPKVTVNITPVAVPTTLVTITNTPTPLPRNPVVRKGNQSPAPEALVPGQTRPTGDIVIPGFEWYAGLAGIGFVLWRRK